MLSLLILLIVYVCYYLTLYPSIPGGDSGELAAEACLYGTAHPPGYPLYTMLMNLVYTISSSSYNGISVNSISNNATVGWHMNHLSCIFGAFASYFIYLTCKELSSILGNRCHILGSAVASILFAFSPLVWEYSVTAEVFALNNLLCTMLVFLTCKIYRLRNVRSDSDPAADSSVVMMNVNLGALVSGLCLSNQHSSLLYVIVLIPYVFYITYPLSLSVSYITQASVSFLLGMSCYLYLYFASVHPKPGSWGDQTTIVGILKHMLRSEYGTFQLGVKSGSETSYERVLYYLQHASEETFHVGLVMLVLLVIYLLYILLRRIINDYSSLRNMNSSNSSSTTNTSSSSSSGINKKDKRNTHKSTTMTAAAPTAAPTAVTTTVKASPTKQSGIDLLCYLLFVYVFYIVVWHCVLSNLPLSSPMAFGVHARFWMQPQILLCIFTGVSMSIYQEHLLAWLKLSSVSSASPYEILLVSIATSFVLSRQFQMMDKSTDGWIMHTYGESILQQLPMHSILVSHTDLNWNTVRYLQHCQHYRSDVTHLSFQLMPFPWFIHKQVPLYPSSVVTFPNTNFPGISTERTSAGNTRLVRSFLQVNDVTHKDIYIDMQAVNEIDIKDAGRWYEFTLVPVGVVYKVCGNLTYSEIESLHHDSYEALLLLKESFPTVNRLYVIKYPKHTWEYAAACLYYDGHYQFGLNVLTYAMAVQKTITPATLPVLIDRYYLASTILHDTLNAVSMYDTLSTPIYDLHKNTALSWLRLQAIVDVGLKFESVINQSISDNADNISDRLILIKSIDQLKSLNIYKKAYDVLFNFTSLYPDDKDNQIFIQNLKDIQMKL